MNEREGTEGWRDRLRKERGGGMKVDLCNVPGKRAVVQKYAADRRRMMERA